MTVVVTNPPFTVQIVANGYADLLPDEALRVYTGSAAKITAGTEPPIGILSYSGMAYDPSSGTIYLFGGGHECWNNEVWSIGVDNLPNNPSATWTKHYSKDHPNYPNSPDTPANCLADTNFAEYPGKWYASGRPISRHTRHSICWMPNLGKFICSGASLSGGKTTPPTIGPEVGWNTNDAEDTWLYDPSGTGWAWKGSTLVNPSYGGRPVCAVYHTGRNILYSTGKILTTYGGQWTTNNQFFFAEYDATGNAWTKHYTGSNPTALTPGSDGVYILPACDPAGDRIICVMWAASTGMKVLVYDIASKTWSAPTTTGTAPPYPEEGDSVVYSTETGLLTFFRSHGAAYYLNCSTWSWSAASFTLPNVVQILGCTAYCPNRKVAFIVFANQASLGVDVYAARV